MHSAYEYGLLYIKRYMRGFTLELGKFGDVWKLKLGDNVLYCTAMCNLSRTDSYKTLIPFLPFTAQCSTTSNKCGTNTAGSSVAGK